MSGVDIAKRKRALKIANAISKIEGAPSSSNAEEIFKQWANGKLTGEQMKARVLAIHQR